MNGFNQNVIDYVANISDSEEDASIALPSEREPSIQFRSRLNDYRKQEEKADTVAAEASAGQKDETAKLPNETVDEYFRRKSKIRDMIFVIRERKQKELGKLIPGSQEYADAMKRFKDWAVPYCTEEFNNPANQARFPDAVRQGLVWFKGLKSQFMEVTQSHINIDAFGNQVVLAHDTWEALFNFRRYAHNVPLVMLAAQGGMKWDEGMRPSVVLLGAKSCGKSYLLDSISRQFHDGVFDDVTHRTAMTSTTGTDNDLKNMAQDEAPASVLGGGCGQSAKEFAGSAAASVAKSAATRKRIHTQTLSMENGERKLRDYYSSNIGTAIYASNVKAPTSSNPQMARLIPLTIPNIEATDEDAIEKLLLKLQETELDPLKKDLLEQRKLINFYLMMTELYIAFGVIQQVQMDAWVMYFQRYCDSMESFSFVLTDPKKVLQITELARTATVNYAVQMGLFSEITFKKRMVDYRDPNSDYVRFFDHARYFVDLIERHLVCTRAVVVYTVSLCREMWANQLRMTALESAYKMTVSKHMSIFDASCTEHTLTQLAKGASKLGTGASSSDQSSSESFEEDPESVDDYGDQYDCDSSNIRPDEDGNFLVKKAVETAIVSDGYKPLTPEQVKIKLEEQKQNNMRDASNRQNDMGGPSKERDDDMDSDDKVVIRDPLVDDSNSQHDKPESKPSAPAAAPAADPLLAAQLEEQRKLRQDNAALNMFLFEYQNGDLNSGVPDVNYIELRGVHMTVAGTCQALAQQVNDGSKPSLDNLETILHEMEQQDITVPFYKLQGRKVVRTDEMNTIKMVRIEHNTARFDPNMAHGNGATRVYVALHSVLNNHSLDKAIVKSIRNLGFKDSLPGRFLINLPVEALRYPDSATDKRSVKMYGICRIVQIKPRDSAFIYVKSSTITPDMLDILTNTRRGSAKVELSPSLLNCSHALDIVVEPEISAAMTHSKLCGMPPGTPLYGTPVILEKLIKQLAQEIPHLRAQKLYSYPRRKMDEARFRYFVQDGHANPLLAKGLQGSLPTNIDMARVARSGKMTNPDTEIMRAIAMTSIDSLVNMIVPFKMRSNPETTFTTICAIFTDEKLFARQLVEIDVTEKQFMDAFYNVPLVAGRQRTKVGAFEHGNGAKTLREIRADNEKKKQTSKVTKVGGVTVTRTVAQMRSDVDKLEMSLDEYTGPVTLNIPTELKDFKKSLSLLMSGEASSHPLDPPESTTTTIIECLNPDDPNLVMSMEEGRSDMSFFRHIMGFDEAESVAARPPLPTNIRPKLNSPPKSPVRKNQPQPQPKPIVFATNKSKFTAMDYVQLDPNK